MGKYQAILLDNLNVGLQVTSALNPAALLPTDAAQSPEQDCLWVTELVYSSTPDLTTLGRARTWNCSPMEAASWTKVSGTLGMRW